MAVYFEGFFCGLVPAFVFAVVLVFKRSLNSVVWE